MIPLHAEFTLARTSSVHCNCYYDSSFTSFVLRLLMKDKAINSDAYVEIGGYLIGFVLGSSLSVILAVAM